MNTNNDLFKVFEGISMGKGVFNLSSSSPLSPTPTQEFKRVNTNDYQQQFNLSPIIQWGKNNKYPEDLLTAARKCSVLLAALSIYSRHLYGQGFYLYRETFTAGQRVIEEVNDTDIFKLLKKTRYQQYYHTASYQLPYWAQVVPIFQMDEKQRIAQLRIYNTRFCRQEKPNPETAIKSNIYVSAQWWRGIDKLITDGKITPEYKNWVTKIALLDDYDPVIQMQNGNLKSWAQWLKVEDTGDDYGSAPWHACYENGWIGISTGTPKMMERLFVAAMTINYMIGVDTEYWKTKFQNWDDDAIWSPEKRVEVINEFQNSIEGNLKGSDKSFKSIFYQLLRGSDGQTQIASIKLDPVNNKIREGDNYIPNAQQANGEIVGAVGLDPSMLGYITAGGKQAGGSGSNIREAMLALNSRMRPDRDLLHSPFYTMVDYTFPDGSKSDIKIGTRDYMINTLDARALTSGSEITAP